MKVLFLDREEPVRRKLQNMIPWLQYKFTQFLESDSFNDASALIQSEKPELIVTDLRLKDISGKRSFARSEKSIITPNSLFSQKIPGLATPRQPSTAV